MSFCVSFVYALYYSCVLVQGEKSYDDKSLDGNERVRVQKKNSQSMRRECSCCGVSHYNYNYAWILMYQEEVWRELWWNNHEKKTQSKVSWCCMKLTVDWTQTNPSLTYIIILTNVKAFVMSQKTERSKNGIRSEWILYKNWQTSDRNLASKSDTSSPLSSDDIISLTNIFSHFCRDSSVSFGFAVLFFLVRENNRI